MFDAILLDNNWICETGGTPESITSIATCQLDVPTDDGGVWLRRVFTLEATDYCVSYMLTFESIPTRAVLFVNGQRLSLNPAGLSDIDITAYVALGENEIAFQVLPDAEGAFAGICLQPTPCD